MAAHLKKRVYEEFSKVVQIPHEETPAKTLRLSKPSKSAALHIDLCKATNSTDALQYLLQFARKPVEAESVEGVVRILLEHYYKETDNSVRLKIASLLGLLSKTQGFSPDCIVDDAIGTLSNEKSHQVLAQLLDTLLVIGSHLPESPAVRLRLIEVAYKVTHILTPFTCLKFLGSRHPTLVLPLVPELLSTHPYFDTPEPDMDDPAYIAVLVLVFNAATSCPTMLALFSDHTFRHYAYLRDSLSHLVPPLRLPGRKQVYGLDSVDSGSGSGSVESSQLFLQQSLNRVSTIQNLEAAGAPDLLDLTIRKLYVVPAAVRDVQSIISDYFGDQDPRVRTAALKAMLQLHERGMKIQQIIYDQACGLLSDDYEQVRSAAVQMVWVLSQLYPESIVPIPSSNEEIRLVDDAFGKISHMVGDGSWMVRVQAAKTLGSMLQVSPHFLEQTLDKKLMSDLRRKRTAHERAKELFASGEFSSGRKWADDAPKEKLDTNTVNLIASGACGAFVHGLEDEMFEVRIAAVEALCQLARSSPSFAEKCLDFLVDMFNDEIEEVRLQSIHVLRQISTHITLREDQLDTVLAVLEDSSRDIREALHELLCFTNVSTKECIQLALLELLKNLNKYPTDRNSVWNSILDETYKLEFLYSGLENRQVATIHHVRLQAKALQLILTARTRHGLDSLISSCEKFLQDIDSFQRLFLTELPHLHDSFVEKLVELLPRLSSCKPVELVKILQTTLRQSGLLQLQLPEQIHRATATIIEPTGESDNPLRFTSGLVVALDIDATLEHVQDPQNSVKVQVLYPDGQSHVIHPKPADFRKPGPDRHRLITQVYLSHTAWTEPSQIEVRLLLAYSSSSASLCSSRLGWSDSIDSLPPAEGAVEGTIPFSKPVKVFIMPKPARR
ncbi:integrator complex subunit 4 [Stegastes partitus]|uniref:Integrator complex subunit 4 n=1 Tax=Stegastes partitus TaxID=144197 RepID=A0A9Y4K4C4_9TELE|nr:PREDICTED: integrator complex subunit 4 [Stegastes partitus]